jgi:hypothetical protein
MTYPDSQNLGLTTSPDGSIYSLHFYGEEEGAAVVTGTLPVGSQMLSCRRCTASVRLTRSMHA